MNQEDKKELLKLARDSISFYFTHDPKFMDDELEKKYSEKRGVFVTLKKDGNLRGCIGLIEPIKTLYDAIVETAQSAAFKDMRFMPLEKEELEEIKIEISILSPLKIIEVDDPEEYTKNIELGKHGLLIDSPDGRKGLLLPQVPVEWNWDVKEFLENLCEKANLPKDAWTDRRNIIYSFECEVFGEEL